MQRYIVAIVMALMLVITTTSVYANEYVNQMTHKYERGVKNVVSCVGEIGRCMSKGVDDQQPFYDGIIGVFEGSGRAIVRAASGIIDIVVAPIPYSPTFPPRPETLFSESAPTGQPAPASETIQK
jgi:putative exosortase-associated protein (TIGR04073 family)